MVIKTQCCTCLLNEICKLKNRLDTLKRSGDLMQAPQCIQLIADCKRWESRDTSSYEGYANSISTASAHRSEYAPAFDTADFCEMCKNRDICSATEKLPTEALTKVLKESEGLWKVKCDLFLPLPTAQVVMGTFCVPPVFSDTTGSPPDEWQCPSSTSSCPTEPCRNEPPCKNERSCENEHHSHPTRPMTPKPINCNTKSKI